MTGRSLVTLGQLAALRTLSSQGLQSDVKVYRATKTDSANADQDVITWTLLETVKGWLRATPATRAEYDAGLLKSDSPNRLHLTVTSQAEPGDRVVIGSEEYFIVDTNRETYYRQFLTCQVRRAE
jgi:hypothetical protein